MNEGHERDEEINERELVSLVGGAVLVAIVLLIFISVSNSSLVNASSWWYQVDLYADHHHGHHVYLPVVGR